LIEISPEVIDEVLATDSMFIIAPQSKKNRFREQVRRPTFKRVELDQKVRFLPYETIEDIDRFVANSDAGLNVDLIVAHSESVV